MVVTVYYKGAVDQILEMVTMIKQVSPNSIKVKFWENDMEVTEEIWIDADTTVTISEMED